MLGKGEAATLAAREALSSAKARGDAERRPVFVLCDGDLGESAGGLASARRAVEHGEADLAVAAFSKRVGGGFGFALGFARWAIRRRCGLRDGRADLRPARAQRAGADRRVAVRAWVRHGDRDDDRRRARGPSRGRDRARPRASRERAHVAGFLHRGRQLVDFARVYARGRLGGRSAGADARALGGAARP